MLNSQSSAGNEVRDMWATHAVAAPKRATFIDYTPDTWDDAELHDVELYLEDRLNMRKQNLA